MLTKNYGINFSFVITVKNEMTELKRLIDVLKNYIHKDDELIIFQDNVNPVVNDIIHPDITKTFHYIQTIDIGIPVRHILFPLNNNFTNFKNKFISECNREYIFHFDADEFPNESLIKSIRVLISQNKQIEMYWVPRINTLLENSKMDYYINLWSWKVNNKGWINFPDYQQRIWKNLKQISFTGNVHERLIGFSTYTFLPPEEKFAYYHPKTLSKQIKQNLFYSQIQEEKK